MEHPALPAVRRPNYGLEIPQVVPMVDSEHWREISSGDLVPRSDKVLENWLSVQSVKTKTNLPIILHE